MATAASPSPTAASARKPLPWPLADIQAACAELASIDPGNTHAVAALLQRMMLGYYADIRIQARKSLYFVAIPTALTGIAFFLIGLVPRYSGQVRYWVIAGSVLEVIAAICCFSYAQASRRLALFHVGLERTNRFILADALCQRLDGERRNEARERLVDVVAQASMLTIDGAAQRELEAVLEGSSGTTSSGPRALGGSNDDDWKKG
jgi:hypothetical protein